MADSKIVTGNREDLVPDISRCLPVRFSGSKCRRCVDICPHGAVTLEGGLAVNKELCRGCLLCTAVCPTGALEQAADFHAGVELLSKVTGPVMGCIRTKESSNASLVCLGGLSEEHLLSLCHSLTGKLALNLSLCINCSNNSMIPILKKVLDSLSSEGLFEGGCRITLAESVAEVQYHDESIDRRGFFRSFRTALFQSTAVIMSTTGEELSRHTPYGDKRLPEKRVLLNRIRKRLSQEMNTRIQILFDSQAHFNENCTACQACVAICPTGALRTEQPDTPPAFDQLLCTGCGLCPEFCLENALLIDPQRAS